MTPPKPPSNDDGFRRDLLGKPIIESNISLQKSKVKMKYKPKKIDEEFEKFIYNINPKS